MFKKLFVHFVEKLVYTYKKCKLEIQIEKCDRLMNKSSFGSPDWNEASDRWQELNIDYSALVGRSNLIYDSNSPKKKK